jgi:polysaccharide biosynthesis/export protein
MFQSAFTTMRCVSAFWAILVVLLCATSAVTVAQTKPAAPSTQTKPAAPSTNATPATPDLVKLPSDYVIGVEDLLVVIFWKEKDLSAEVVVRPDGKISLPMLNDVEAAGLTPQQLASVVEKAALKYVREPGASVLVKEIRSRKIYVIGEVAKPGPFPLSNEMNVLQAIAGAGGLLEHAKKSDIVIVRNENGRERRFRFNYNDVVRGKNTAQNIRLLPGDTILVR